MSVSKHQDPHGNLASSHSPHKLRTNSRLSSHSFLYNSSFHRSCSLAASWCRLSSRDQHLRSTSNLLIFHLKTFSTLDRTTRQMRASVRKRGCGSRTWAGSTLMEDRCSFKVLDYEDPLTKAGSTHGREKRGDLKKLTSDPMLLRKLRGLGSTIRPRPKRSYPGLRGGR